MDVVHGNIGEQFPPDCRHLFARRYWQEVCLHSVRVKLILPQTPDQGPQGLETLIVATGPCLVLEPGNEGQLLHSPKILSLPVLILQLKSQTGFLELLQRDLSGL